MLVYARRTRFRNVVGGQTSVPLLAATAILAAAVGNPIVEGIASTGLVGRGYVDVDRSSVLPVCLLGLLVAIATFVARSLQEWRGSRSSAGSASAAATVRDASPRARLLQFSIVFALQMVVVFAMESSEALLTNGGPVDSNAWLGGPVWFSLLAHGSICLVVTTLLRRVMRSFVAKAVHILRETERFLKARSLEEASKSMGRAVPSHFRRALDPGVRRVRGRAPPPQLASI